jgi:hypothetical protein
MPKTKPGVAVSRPLLQLASTWIECMARPRPLSLLSFGIGNGSWELPSELVDHRDQADFIETWVLCWRA